MTTELLPFQREGVKLLSRFKGRALLADVQGLGKTIQALAWLKQHPQRTPAIVVCPAVAKYGWQWQTKHHCNMNSIILEGRTPYAIPDTPLIILNYDILNAWLPTLLALHPTLIVFDECQNLMNLGTQRARAGRQLAEGIPYIFGLSGTPCMNRPAELFPILNILFPRKFHSMWAYGWKYCEPKQNRGKWEFKGASNIPALHRRLKRIGMIRRTKEQVLKDLPEKIHRIVPIELKDYDEYHEASTNFKKWIKRKKPGKAKSALKMEILTRIAYLRGIVGRLKVRGINGWIDQHLEETDEKLILFCYHRKMVKALHERYQHISVYIDGSVNSKQRFANVEQFQKNSKTKLIIGNLAMTTAVTLTAANNVAFTECFWRPADHAQAADRAHRIGQHKQVWVNWLMAGGTIDEKMCEIIQRKQGVISGILDGAGNGEDMSVFDLLVQSMQNEDDE